ncbi:SWIM zinc finger family protein [Williamsia soli]|uniref:SWIM zinc finger family protein n=1 Tax=Williamsia soli TaxID=364929 RepID=UPI001A9EBA48|nr:SWIM zinc finger family protein [Williamsia soli]
MGTQRWRADQVLALAPDAGSQAAGRKLAIPTPWSSTGAVDNVVWGLCTGSGRNPYQTIVDLSGPAYRCSCPSRKFPCKHALGLLLLWAAGGVPDAPAVADFARPWIDERAAKAAAAPVRTERAEPKDPERAARTAEQRAVRMAGGLEEFEMWLSDQVRGGLAGAEADPYRRFDPVAARLVDAQVPGLARRVRELPALVTGARWPERLLRELAMLRLLARAHRRIDELDPAMAANVRRHLGYPVAKADVLATEPVIDTWQIVAVRDRDDEQLITRRVWLWGHTTGRCAVVLSFSPTAAGLDGRFIAGMSFAGPLHFYPGTPPLRALVPDGDLRLTALTSGTIVGTTVQTALGRRADAIAEDPWLQSFPVVIAGRPALAEGRRLLVDDDGVSIDLDTTDDRWFALLAVSGGHPVRVFGELGTEGLDPVATEALEAPQAQRIGAA